MNNAAQFEVRYRAGFYEASRPGFPGRCFGESPAAALGKAAHMVFVHQRPTAETPSNRDAKREFWARGRAMRGTERQETSRSFLEVAS